jgi:tRNA-2-methylthio-N6-dimethylallyladenosine synthase
LDDQVPQAEKSERLQRLQAAIDRQQAAFNARFIGRTLEVLIEKSGRNPGQLVGRSPYLQPVHVTAAASLIGTVVPLTVTSIEAYSLFGTLASPTRVPELATAGA